MKPYYDDGKGIVIYHGDCREILPSLSGVALVVTSPPYNQADKIDRGRGKTTRWHQMGNTAAWYPDAVPHDEYARDQAAMLNLCADTLIDEGSIVYNHKPKHIARRVRHPLDWIRRAERCALVDELIWHTPTMMAFNAGLFVPSHEMMYWLCKADQKPRWPSRAAMMWGSVWRMGVDREAPGHPCAFPRSLPLRWIEAMTVAGEIILDPCMGSGTTLRAAKDLGRTAIGVELEERYCDIAAKRLSQEVLAL